MTEKMSREDCLLALAKIAQKEGRLPKKSDFADDEAARIKSFFGPWPRALEAAALKPDKSKERVERNREKRAKGRRKGIETMKNKTQ